MTVRKAKPPRPRRSKFRIVRLCASTKAHSLHCSSSSPKVSALFGNPYTSERLMYCGALGQHSACRQAGVPVGTLTRRKRQAKNYFKKGKKKDMENRFIRAEDVAQELNVSKPYAYKLIRQLNEELKAKGFITIAGRVNRQYFYERLYGAGKGEM